MNILFRERYISLKTYAVAHKLISTIIVLAIFGGTYYGYTKYTGANAAAIKYTIGVVERGTVVPTIQGSGQVSASNEVDLKTKASGVVTSVTVQSGAHVGAGAALVAIDPRDAEINLESSRIALQKLTQSADSLDIASAKDSVTKAQNDEWNAISDTFLAYSNIFSGMKSLYYDQAGYLGSNQATILNSPGRSLRDSAGASFDKATMSYQNVLAIYNTLSRSSDPSKVETLLEDVYAMSKLLADSLKATQTAVSYFQANSSTYNVSGGINASSDTTSWLTSVNSHLSSLLSAKNTLQNSEDSLTKLTKGADPLDIASQELSVRQREYAYQDYFVTAPFDGVMAKLLIKKGDSVSSGTSIGTFITEQKIANITLNEVDVAKVKVGKKVTLTFDAVEDLSLTGQVVEVDLVGTVSQGVVSYNVKIGFDTQDNRVLSGMSVSAYIATDTRVDVLVVPSSAIKQQGNSQYVEVFDSKTPVTTGTTGVTSSVLPTLKIVEVGLSDDSVTEIISGLSEGEKIVTKTIAPTVAKTTTAPSLLGGGSTRVGR